MHTVFGRLYFLDVLPTSYHCEMSGYCRSALGRAKFLFTITICFDIFAGRFDDEIVEERRLAALELLNFLSSQPHLFNSLAVQQFFEVGLTFELMFSANI